MTAVREKWTEMSWFRRILLLWMAAMILGFGIAMPVVRAAQGIEYGDDFLRLRQEGEVRYYEGEVDWEDAAFTVWPDGRVEYRWGEYTCGPYQVSVVPDAAPEGFGSAMTGLEIRQGDQVLFRGGYLKDAFQMLYQENGEPLWEIRSSVSSGSGAVLFVDGREVSPEEQHEPSLTAVARAALYPELVRRGSVGIYLLVTLLALLNMLQICFPGFFFRLSLWGHVRNVEDAEPSEFYIAAEHAEWVLLALLVPVLYWYGLFTVFS